MTIGGALQGVARPSGWKAWFLDKPRRLQLVLDGCAVALAAASFAQVSDPDLLFHCIWVVLAVEAFLFGLRFTMVRIVIVMALVVVYAVMAEQASGMVDLGGLAEWPLMAVIAITVAVMADQLASTSRRYANLYRQANDRLLTAQEDERLRLARDLHDGVGQTLTALRFTLDAAVKVPWTEGAVPPDMTRHWMGRAQQLAALALDETRDVAFRLRPARFAETGLAASIQELAARVGNAMDVSIEPDLIRPHLLDPGAEMEVYRIVQEALGNAIRHSDGDRIWIDIRAERDTLLVTVGDDGQGFDRDRVGGGGLGLAGMLERAAILRAGLEITTAAGRGTVVSLTVPFADNRARAKLSELASGHPEAAAAS